MAAIVNGLSLSKLRPFGATFFIFSDYARPAIRLSSLMELPTLLIFAHDAMGDGEDGPTHQPVEQLLSLRTCRASWCCGLATPAKWSEGFLVPSLELRHQPAVLRWLVTGSHCPRWIETSIRALRPRASRAAYVLADPARRKSRIDSGVATGSEVSLAVQAAGLEKLLADGIRSRVVSMPMPSWDIFDHQSPREYRDTVLPPKVKGSHRGRASLNARLGALTSATPDA